MTVGKLFIKINIIVTCAALVYCQDPDKTITVGSYKYELFNDGKTLADAKTVCRDRDAWLVEIKYKEINDAVISLTDHDVIIGGKQLGNAWKWNDGSSMRYTNWASNPSSGDCLVMIARDRTWQNKDCTASKQRYICQSDMSYKRSFLITAFGNSVTHEGAKTACEKNQSRLVDIKTIALDSYVHTLISQDSWTSGRYEGGSWKWGDKSSIAGTNLPSGKINHCLMKTASNTWKSELCTAEAGYICQKNVTSGTCDDEVCLNGGTCTIIDERFICLCDAGFFGTKCEKRIIFINTSETEFTVGKVTILNVAFTIVSYDGDVTVTANAVKKNETSNITTNKLTASVYIKMGPFNANANSVKQVITAVSKSRNTKSNSITMTIKIDHCIPNPCKNEANCKNLDKEPYFKCECSPSYGGRTCEERIYVEKGNCTYHVNIDEKVRFEQANSTCHNLAGSLAMMKTSSIQNFVETQVAKQYEEAGKGAGLWIGGIKREDSWYWLDGTSIPLAGSDAKWAGSSEYMANRSRLILDLYGSISSNIRWFSRNDFGYGYVCEIAKTDLCKSITCKNGGKCVVIGCSNITNCQCVAGYTGIQCEKDIFKVTTHIRNFTSIIGQSIYLTLNVSNYTDPVQIDVFLNSAKSKTPFARYNVTEIFDIAIGPFKEQSFGTTYWFRATPIAEPDSYYKFLSINVVVQGPPEIQSITPKVLDLPFKTINSTIDCVATGVPLPTVYWYKNDRAVTSNPSDYIYQAYQPGQASLIVKNDTRHDLGYYTCHSYSLLVNGRKETSNDTAYLRGKIKFVSATSSFDHVHGNATITCIYEGYPIPNVHWKWLPPNNITSQMVENQQLSIRVRGSPTDGFSNSTSQLHIKLYEYLGQTKFACYGSNIYENTSHKLVEINQNNVVNRNRVFHFFDFAQKRNYSVAQEYCENIAGNLAKITDNQTQEVLAAAATEQANYIGAKKHTEDRSKIWRWHDHTFLYNETEHRRQQNEVSLPVDGLFVTWANRAPTPNGECLAMLHENKWKWSNINCSTLTGFICEKNVAGIPQMFENTVDECSSNITINWSPASEAIGIQHMVHVKEGKNLTTVYSEFITPNDQLDTFRRNFTNLKRWTSYRITITVCPETCAYPSATTKTVTTHAGIPGSVNSANVTRINKTCIILWKMDVVQGITGFIINAVSTIVRDESGSYIGRTYTETHDVSNTTTHHYFESNFNRNYSFYIRAQTCAGAGPARRAVGNCVTYVGPPDEVHSSRIAYQPNVDDTMNITILFPNDINGPISCLFVVVVFMPNRSAEGKVANLEDLSRAALVNESEPLTENEAYIAIAISKSDVDKETTEKRNFSRKLGDESLSTCNLTQTKKYVRRKREVSSTTAIRAVNLKLLNGATYSYYTLSTTAGEDGGVYIKTSNITYFTKVRYSSPTDKSNQARSNAIIIVVIIVILACVVSAFLWFKKKRRRDQKQPDVVSLTDMTAQTAPEPEYANLAMDNPEENSETEIPLSRLLEVYNSLRADASAKFYDQFQKLKQAAKTIDYPTQNATAESLKRKNRYKNILPSDHSRVILKGEGDYSYINACYISGYRRPKKYIATQGPLATTIVDFWRMIFEQKVQVIVMLAKCMENGKRKCEKYWPALGSFQQYGDITVINAEEISCGCFKLRTFGMIKNNEEFKVQQMQFVDWPDHGVPTTTTTLIRFCSSVAEQESNGPIVVHCSAGAGRTGTFIAYNFLLEKCEIRNSVDVYKCVLELRKQRVDMVQTCEQYMLLHKLILEHHLYGITDVDPTIIKNMRDSSRDWNTMLKTQYENLSFIGPISQVKCGVGEKISAMNRNNSIVPYENNHVFISRLQDDTESPYLNASTIEAYGNASKMIAAQGPLKNTVEYFWRAIIDNNIKTIIMLTKCTEKKKEQCYQYWPEEKNTETKVGKITIKLRQEDDKETIIQREFFVKRKDVEMTVIQYQYTGWKSNECPRNASAVLEMIDKMQSSLHRDKDASVLVHCRDGAGRAGAFCAIVNLIERLKAENKIDVFRAVKDLRDCRPGMVQTLDQYRFCFKAVSEYLALFSLYDNVDADEDDEDQTEDNPYVTV